MSANEYSPVAGNRFTSPMIRFESFEPIILVQYIRFDKHLIFVLCSSRIEKVQNFEVKTMFSQGDDEKMEDLWLKMLQSHEFIRGGGNTVAVNFNL